MENQVLPYLKTEITKSFISEQSQIMIDKVKDGYVNPLEALSCLNALSKIIEETRKGIMEDAIDEFEKHGSKEVALLGAKISKAEAGVRYDFSKNTLWNEIKARETEISKERKDLEKKLKTFTKAGMISIDDEMIEVLPPVRTSTTVVKIQFN